MAANVNNYIAAGNAAVKNTYASLAAARDNAPKYDEIAKQGMEARTKEKISAMRADMDVERAKVKAETELKTDKIISDANTSIKKSNRKTKFAGKIAAAGAAIATSLLPAAEIIKPSARDFSTYRDKLQGNLDTSKAEVEKWKGMPDADPSVPADATFTPSTAGNTTVSSASTVRTPGGKSSGSIRTWEQAYTLAQQSGAKFPELVAAQWQHESAHGTALGGTNNYFGIKAGKNESSSHANTFEYSGGSPYNTSADFKNFDTPEAAFQELTDRWHNDWGSYTGVSSSSQTAAEAAQKLKAQGYATDPNYAPALIRIMQERGY